MLAVACCRCVSITLHRTPDITVGYSFSVSHTLIASTSRLPWFSRRYNCATIFCCVTNHRRVKYSLSEHHSSSATPKLRLRSLDSRQAAFCRQHCLARAHLGGLSLEHRSAWSKLFPVFNLMLFARQIYPRVTSSVEFLNSRFTSITTSHS